MVPRLPTAHPSTTGLGTSWNLEPGWSGEKKRGWFPSHATFPLRRSESSRSPKAGPSTGNEFYRSTEALERDIRSAGAGVEVQLLARRVLAGARWFRPNLILD